MKALNNNTYKLIDNNRGSSKEPLVQTSFIGSFGNLSLSALGGFIFGGTSGILMSTSATIADEVLITNGYTTKHYLSSTILWSSLINPVTNRISEFFPEHTAFIHTAGLGLAGAISYFSNDPLNYHKEAKKITDSLLPTIKIFDEKDLISVKGLKKITNNFQSNSLKGAKLIIQDMCYVASSPLIKNLAANISIGFLKAILNNEFVKYIGNNGTSMLAVTLLQQNSQATISELTTKAGKMSIAYFIKQLLSTGLDIGKDYLNNKFSDTLEEKIIEHILFKEENVNKILRIDNLQNISNNIVQDYKNSFGTGSTILNNTISSKSNQLLALKNILTLAQESIIFTQFFGHIKNKLFQYSQLRIQKLNKLCENSSFSKSNTITDFSSNIPKILQTSSLNFIKELYFYFKENEKDMKFKIQFEYKLSQTLLNGLDVFENIVNMVYYGHKFINDHLKIEQIPLLNGWLEDFNKLLQSSNINIINNGEERVKLVFEALMAELDDKIVRCKNNDNKVIIQNYHLQQVMEEKIIDILEIPFLEFKGNHIGILGISGLGKSTILKDIKGCMTKPFISSGNISLPEGAKIMFIDQDTYIPSEATLFEGVMMQMANKLEIKEKEQLEEQIISLFNELEVYDQFDVSGVLHDRKYKPNNLSGGQKKKIAIIKAIIAKPDILFADEIFTGLDKNSGEKFSKESSLEKVQKALTKYLPNTKIIVVDHDAKLTNNWAETHKLPKFYDDFVDFMKFKNNEEVYIIENDFINVFGNNEDIDGIYF